MTGGKDLAGAGAGDENALLDALARDVRAQAASGAETLCVARLLALAPWSRRQTERRFRERFLTSPARYFRDCQTERAEQLLQNGADVLSAASDSGFASAGRLHDALVQRRGVTPGEVRRKGAGVTIDYGFFDTQIGVVLIAATERGLCALRIGAATGANEKLAEVRQDFPQADFCERPEAVQAYADQLVAFLEARADTFSPRLDLLTGTTFQREVWAELQRVAPGERISYSELARRVGRPDAVRAVAGACASNNVAIAIPCHRIVRKGGALSGYRWGREWKARLLELEAQMVEPRAS